eukprot:6491326-Amphidinium_carterae.3
MGQATLEAQHIKQVLDEMAILNLTPHITMSIKTDSSAAKPVGSRLGLNTATLLVHPRHRATWRDDNHEDSNNPQSSRCVYKASTIDNSSVTLGAKLSTDDSTDSQHTTSFNIDEDDNSKFRMITTNIETDTAAEARASRTTTVTQFRRRRSALTPQSNANNHRQLAERNSTTTMMILEPK